jgi:hypothetical protein
MTTHERQQSLTAARLACEWLRWYFNEVDNHPIGEQAKRLIMGFEILDAKEEAQANAGRESGHLGAEYGKLGGRPRTKTKKRGKK